MYGLEKKPKDLFEFDLESELNKNPNKVKELIVVTDGKIEDIKSQIRLGAKGADADHLGILLHGYTALRKVLVKYFSDKGSKIK